MKKNRLFLAAAVLSCLPGGVSATDSTFVEFLWSQTPTDAIARQPTRGFLLDGSQRHQVCVALLAGQATDTALRIDVIDAAGELISRQDHDDFTGTKRCYAAALDDRGTPGEWTFNIHLDGALRTAEKIEVARNLEEAPFYRASGIPYVLGRPNYDATIPESEFSGRLVWVMHVDEAGTVTHVEVEIAEGVGTRMQDRAIAAGYLSLFPPDPARAVQPLIYRRELTFRPD